MIDIEDVVRNSKRFKNIGPIKIANIFNTPVSLEGRTSVLKASKQTFDKYMEIANRSSLPVESVATAPIKVEEATDLKVLDNINYVDPITLSSVDAPKEYLGGKALRLSAKQIKVLRLANKQVTSLDEKIPTKIPTVEIKEEPKMEIHDKEEPIIAATDISNKGEPNLPLDDQKVSIPDNLFSQMKSVEEKTKEILDIRKETQSKINSIQQNEEKMGRLDRETAEQNDKIKENNKAVETATEEYRKIMETLNAVMIEENKNKERVAADLMSSNKLLSDKVELNKKITRKAMLTGNRVEEMKKINETLKNLTAGISSGQQQEPNAAIKNPEEHKFNPCVEGFNPYVGEFNSFGDDGKNNEVIKSKVM